MLSIPKKSANSTGINKYQQPKHNPYAADENTIKYEWLSNGIAKTARPAPKMLFKIVNEKNLLEFQFGFVEK